jgi:uncharacterized membrane protein YccC
VQAFTVRFRDPNRVNLRKAARAAIVVPALLAVLVATDHDAAALFASFGAFAALVFCDFGGALGRRFRAYVLLAIVGGVLVAVGTAAADTTSAAVVVAGAFAFLIALSGALGGYFAAGGTAATLAIVLAVMTPGVEADLAAREVGWIGGVLLAGLTAIALWPAHQRDRVRESAARVLREGSRCLRAPAATRDLSTLEREDAVLGERSGVVYRPAGSITRERALVALVIGARRLVSLVHAITAAEQSSDADPSPEYHALATTVADALTVCGDILTGDHDEPPDVEAIERARAAHVQALERWTASTVEESPTRVVDRFAAAFPLRRLALAAAQMAVDAHDAMHDVVRSKAAGEAAAASTWAVLRAHWSVRSVRFRNAARAGLGIALAVLVAKTTSVEHAFWVVLGALSVLRSNALGTGVTALQALVGALLGLGVASVVMTTVGGDEAWLWILLPVVVFLAAYTPGAVNFVVGQAGFTVFVVVMFNLIVPGGWRTGLVRVQDVAIGAVVAVVVGALLWPRGARGVARRAFADLLRAGAMHLRLALEVTLRGAQEDVDAAATAVADARARAAAALADLVLEHGGGHVDREGWGALLIEALVVELAADGIARVRLNYGVTEACADTRQSLAHEGRAVGDGVERDADRLVEGGVAALAGVPAVATPLPPSVPVCLSEHARSGLDHAIGLVWVHEWLTLVAEHPR